jgi:uncharacterized protein (TIGR02001 family)
MRAPRSPRQREPAPARAAATRRHRCSPERAFFAVGAVLALFASVAAAQVSGTVSLLSDYRYRGVSLSDNKPAAQLGLTYDDASGWYAGFFASTIRFAMPASRGAQTTYFAGYARRTPSGLSVEAGADYSVYTVGRSYRYPEVYVGVTSDNISARLYYASRYYFGDSDTLYGEVNATNAVSDRIRLLAHVGVLRSGGADAYASLRDFVFDGRVGVAVEVEQFSVQLAWIGVSSSSAYPMSGADRRHTVVLSVSRSF